MSINILISIADVIVSLIFAILVARQYSQRKKMHQLMWGIALAAWVIGIAAELGATLNDWTPLTYRAYYATGALLIPAWLGLGTLYLVAPRRLADLAFWIVGVLSVIGVGLIALWQIDPTALHLTPEHFVPLKVFPFFPVQLVLIVLNVFGTLAFVGGALWSAYHFAKMKTGGERVIATILIGVGGAIAASAHSLGVVSGIELFRPSELVAVAFIFAGFLMTNPRTNVNPAPASNASET